MMNNIQNSMQTPQSLYKEMLQTKNINVDNVPQSVDMLVINKNKEQTRKNVIRFGVIASVVSIIASEGLIYLTKNKKSINEYLKQKTIKSYRRAQLFSPIIWGLISLAAYFETQIKKKIGLISKEDIYRSQGFNVNQEKYTNRYKLSSLDYTFMGTGVAVSLLKSLSKGKIKVPTIESGFNNKVLSTATDAILNGVAFGGIYTIGKAIFNKKNN